MIIRQIKCLLSLSLVLERRKNVLSPPTGVAILPVWELASILVVVLLFKHLSSLPLIL